MSRGFGKIFLEEVKKPQSKEQGDYFWTINPVLLSKTINS
jgi:hypothetical protein